MSRIHRLTTATGAMLAVIAIAAGPAGAQSQDLRSPDARDAANPAGTTSVSVQDLRSPDARDAAEGRSAPVVVRVQRTAEPAADSGLSWDSIGIGALMTAGLLASIAGAFVLVGRRRGHGPRVA